MSFWCVPSQKNNYIITWGQNWVRVASHNRCMQFNMFWYVLYLMEYPFCCGTEGAPTSASTCLFQTIGSCKLMMSSNRPFIGFINWVWILSNISHHFILPVTVHHQRKHLQIKNKFEKTAMHPCILSNWGNQRSGHPSSVAFFFHSSKAAIESLQPKVHHSYSAISCKMTRNYSPGAYHNPIKTTPMVYCVYVHVSSNLSCVYIYMIWSSYPYVYIYNQINSYQITHTYTVHKYPHQTANIMRIGRRTSNDSSETRSAERHKTSGEWSPFKTIDGYGTDDGSEILYNNKYIYIHVYIHVI